MIVILPDRLKPALFFLVVALSSTALPAQEPIPQLILSGVESEAADNIKRSIDLSRYQCNDADWQLTRLQKRVREQATTALQALGYYNSEIKPEIRRGQKCWEMLLDVEAGKRVVIGSLKLEIIGEMKDLPALKNLIAEAPLKRGNPLNHADYKKTRTEIEILAARFGFFSGEFKKHRLDINTKTSQADIELVFDSGTRASFTDIKIDQDVFTDELIDQYITLTPGMPYDSQLLIKQQQKFNGTGYFSDVIVDTVTDENNPAKVGVAIKLEPAKQHAYRIKLGASTDVGPRVGFAYKNRRVNRHGHEFSFDSSFSPVRNELTADYGIPKGNSGNDRLDYQVGYLNEDTDTSELESYKLAVLYTHPNRHDWITTTFLEYLYEDFKTADADRLSKFLMPGFKLQKTVVDNSLFPQKGWRANASLRLASEDVLSSTNLIQLKAAFKFVLPIGKSRLLVRTDIGASEVDEFEKLPASLRFFAGGDGSVRGFDYKSLGPTDDDDDVIGGQYLLTSSIEYEYPLRDKWGLAAFVDTGNAFNNLNDYELSTGVGFGVRWHSPIGPIRLDIAQDTDLQEDPRIHLSMGLDL